MTMTMVDQAELNAKRAWATLATFRRRVESLEAAATAGTANLQEAWTALAMIREAIEPLGVGLLPASEHLPAPTFTAEAEAIVAAIGKLTTPRK